MESKRALIAAGLSLLVLILWSQFFAPQQKPKQIPEEVKQEQTEKDIKESPKEAPKETAEVKEEKSQKEVVEKVEAATKEEEQQQELELEKARVIKVNNGAGIYSISEIGGKLTSFQIIGMKEVNTPDSPLKELVGLNGKDGSLEFIDREGSIKGLKNALYKADTEQNEIDATSGEKKLVLTWTSKNDIEIEKIYTFKPKSFMFDMEIRITNNGSKSIDDNLGIILKTLANKEGGGRYAFRGLGAYMDEHLKEKDLGDIKDGEGVLNGKVSWGGYETSYFLQALLPMEQTGEAEKGSIKAVLTNNPENDKTPIITITYLANPVKIGPGEKETKYFKAFFGPKKIKLLNDAGYHLDKSINMGWFDIIAKPFLYFLNFTNDLVGNFGVAIIILTIVVKLLFWPLTQKSYKSMKAMQALQPQMMKLREKFKNDKQRLNQEMMGLYKAHKVNPMGGCLPMVIQIPVFIALYRLLDYAIELRHTPFMFWIQDLSAPDRLFRFPFSIPGMEPPYGIPVLTLLMGASMFITQKMTPTPGDPTQAKIMLLMPIIFTFIFINFPSGLVLYWLTQNILSIGQQYWVNKKK